MYFNAWFLKNKKTDNDWRLNIKRKEKKLTKKYSH